MKQIETRKIKHLNRCFFLDLKEKILYTNEMQFIKHTIQIWETNDGFIPKVRLSLKERNFRYVIQEWDLNGATEIPAPVSEETTVLRFPMLDKDFFASDECDCRPLTGKCSNGYRIAWIIKKTNPRPGSVPVRELVAITNVEYSILGDRGVVALTIRRGLGRRNINDAGTAFTEGLPVVITAGDTIVFGPVVPSTQCKPQA